MLKKWYVVLIPIFVLCLGGCSKNISLKDINQNEIGNNPNNLMTSGKVAEQDGWLYYADGEETDIPFKGGYLYKSKIGGGEKERLVFDRPNSINVKGKWVYYEVTKGISDSTYIYKIDLNGDNKTLLIKYGYKPLVYDNYLFYIDDEKIYKYNLKNGKKKRLTSGNEDSSFVLHYVIDNGMIYYTDISKEGNLYKIDLNGNNKTRLNSISTSLFNVENGTVVFDDIYNGEIYKMNTNGENIQKIIGSDVSYFVLNNGLIFFISRAGGQLYKVNLEGKEKEKLTDKSIDYLDVHNNFIYFISNGELFKIKRDGSDEERISS